MEPASAFESLSGVYLDATVELLCVRCGWLQGTGFLRSLGVLFWFGFPHFMPVVLWMSSIYLVVRYLNYDSSKYGSKRERLA